MMLWHEVGVGLKRLTEKPSTGRYGLTIQFGVTLLAALTFIVVEIALIARSPRQVVVGSTLDFVWSFAPAVFLAVLVGLTVSAALAGGTR